MSYDFGDVVLVPFPFTDHSTTKKRPAIVVSSAAYHQRRADLILLAVTSQPPAGVGGDTVLRDWKKAGLLKPSVAKPVLATIDQRLILKKLGRLSQKDRQALQSSLQDILGE